MKPVEAEREDRLGLKDLEKKLMSLSVPEEGVQDFLSRMDRDYLSLYSPAEIADHIRMASCLDRDRPAALKIVSKNDRDFEITIVAFDYFSEVSILCGLLASFGLDIQAGNVHTFSDEEAEPALGNFARPKRTVPRKIVDVFQTSLVPGEAFDAERRQRLEEALVSLVRLLKQDKFNEARDQVNRHLIAYLSKAKVPEGGLLQPLTVRFDNRSSGRWTVLDIHGKDTPGFLYAFSNALSLRGIYIHKVQIKNVGTEIQDRFYISDRRGRKIAGEREKKALRISAALIKQFTHFLVRSPDPTKAIAHFDQLLDKIIEEEQSRSLISFLKKRETLHLLARLFGSSDYLWEDFLRIQFENLLPLLDQYKGRKLRIGKEALRRGLRRALRKGTDLEERKRILNEYKDRELFRIDMKHLLEPPRTLTDFSQALTDLAEVVIEETYALCGADLVKRHGAPRLEDGRPSSFAICGLGKLGGAELGYASDIELLFVYEGAGQTDGAEPIDNRFFFEKLAQQITHFITAKQEGIFHIDTRLRPHGNAGVLANPLAQLTAYYAPTGEAAPFERQALIKLRSIAGDEVLGRRVEAHRDQFVYGGAPWDLKTALELRERQRNELVPKGKINVKYSAGGLLDIEYAVQYLQILHGYTHPALRTPHTLAALDQLRRLKILDKKSATDFHEAYLFLRALIDALRIVRGHAKDLILPEVDTEEFTFLARRMGYGQRDWERGRKEFEEEIRHYMSVTQADFVARFEGK
jgi:glutamate-ammonia-ligase adenylyltransferase